MHLLGRLSAQSRRILLLALGLMAALAINELAKGLFEYYYPDEGISSLKAKALYAIVLVLLAVFLSAHLSEVGDKELEEKKMKLNQRCLKCQKKKDLSRLEKQLKGIV